MNFEFKEIPAGFPLHEALGYSPNEVIPTDVLKETAKREDRIGKLARFALALRQSGLDKFIQN